MGANFRKIPESQVGSIYSTPHQVAGNSDTANQVTSNQSVDQGKAEGSWVNCWELRVLLESGSEASRQVFVLETSSYGP